MDKGAEEMKCKCGYNSEKPIGKAMETKKKGLICKVKLNHNGLLLTAHYQFCKK